MTPLAVLMDATTQSITYDHHSDDSNIFIMQSTVVTCLCEQVSTLAYYDSKMSKARAKQLYSSNYDYDASHKISKKHIGKSLVHPPFIR